MTTKKDKYPQVGPRDWMNQHGWYAERGGYKPQQGVLPQIMPGMYPGNVPMVMNQHATEPVYMDVPAYAHGGFYQRPGYFYNGHDMQKAVGSGTYDNGMYFQQGGYPHPLDRPFDTFEYGGYTDDDIDNGYTGNVSREAALRQIECMQMGGYSHPLDTPFDEYKKGGNWIPKHLKKGRCTPMGTAECPVGSPQYNLAKTFKKHHGFHKKEQGGPVNPFNALRKFATGGTFGVGEYEDPSTIPLQAPPPPVDPLAPDPNDLNDPRNMDPRYAQQNNASKTGVVQPPPDPATTAPWRAGMTDEQAQQNLNDRPSTSEYAKQFQTPKKNWGDGILGIGAGILGAASILHDNYHNRGVQQQWMRDQNKSDNLPRAINPMSKGTYDQYGNMPYNNMSQSSNIRTMQRGGQYEKNKTYDLDDATINDLIRKGYKIQRL